MLTINGLHDHVVGSFPATIVTSNNDRNFGRREQRSNFKIPATTKDSRKLFVGGLPVDVTSHEFLAFFQQFGTVLDSVVMFDRETRKPRGFGFVTFDDSNVCRQLLKMGQMQTLDEEKQSDCASSQSSGRLEMRGKVIEVKSAQPKSPTVNVQPNHGPAYTASNVSVSDDGSQYDDSYARKRNQPAHDQHSAYTPSLYGYAAVAPQNPLHYHINPATPVTPQAAIDMAHHMMFYSQLLATPTLISPILSPMMSPMAMAYEQHFHSYNQQFQPYKPHSQTDTTHFTPPTASDPDEAVEKPTGSHFRIGGATFYPEEPLSPMTERA